MKLSYDKEADAAYIYVKEKIGPGEVKQTTPLNGDVNLDFNKDNKLIGIEILNASKIMPRKVIIDKITA